MDTRWSSIDRLTEDETLTIPTWAVLSIVGSGVLILGSFRPWTTLTVSEAENAGISVTETAGGLAGDGVTTLFFATLVIVTVLVSAYRYDHGPGTWTAMLATFSGLSVGFVAYAVYDGERTLQRAYTDGAGGVTATLDLHASLFVVVLGAMVLVASGLVGIVRTKQRRAR